MFRSVASHSAIDARGAFRDSSKERGLQWVRHKAESRRSSVVGWMALGLTSATAVGQSCVNEGCYRYRVIDLGRVATLEPDLNLPPAGVVSFGINDGGVLVWAASMSSTTTLPIHAFARIAFSGTGPVGTYDLHALAGLTDQASFATDINEAGLVGGASGAGVPTPGIDCGARVWELGPFLGAASAPSSVVSASLHPESLLIDLVPDPTSCTSVIAMVTDGSNPEVIGMATSECVDEICRSADPFVAFRRTASGGVAIGFPPTGGSRQSYGFGAVGSATLGYDNEIDDGGNACELGTLDLGCLPSLALQEANEWTSGGVPSQLAKLEAPGVGPSEVRDTLPTGQCVGAGYATIGAGCGFHATFWESPTSAVVDLGVVYDAAIGPTSRLTKAEGVGSDGELVRVVGGDLDGPTGVLWERDTTWCANRLDDISLGGPSGASTLSFNIRWAHDVNASGFIIAHGTSSAGDGRRALLLTCPLDLDGSMSVGSGDLALLLGAWGQAVAWADLDFDGTVGSGDLAVLLGGWTGNAMCEIGPSQDLCAPSLLGPSNANAAQASEGAGVESGAFDSALAALGFASADAFVAWASTATDAELHAAGTWLAAIMQQGGGS